VADIYETADSFRASLLKRERAAASQMVRAYGLSWQRIQIQLARLTKQIEQARARGEDVNQYWLLRQERYFALNAQVLAELQRFIKFAEPTIIAEQKAAVEAAQQQAATLMSKATGEARAEGSFNKLSPLAVERMVGFAGDGSPLRTLLNKLGADAALRVSDALTQAVALGYNPRKTAAQIRAALGGNLARALLISRTETIRAHREASRQTYLANSDVVEGWQWVAALGPRSCPVCWAMHGTIHPLTEPLASHPACRCTSIPIVDLSAPSRVKPGAEEFARLSEAEQRQILGPGKFAAYNAGKLPLENLVGFRRDPQWGPVRFERSLSAAKTGPVAGAMPAPLPPKAQPVPQPAPQPKPKAAPKQAFPADIAGLHLVKQLGGSTGAQLVEDPLTGKRFVLKRGANPDHLMEEAHADAAYAALGIPVPKSKIYQTPAGPAKLAEFVEGRTLSQITDAKERAKAEAALREHFAADALLGNWDVIGLGADNVLVDKKGKVWRIDNGGSLRFRAQGAPKSAGQWDDYPTELWTMRDAHVNPSAAQVFGKVKFYDVAKQVDALEQKRAALLKALPADLRAAVGARLDQLKDVARIGRTFEADKWEGEYADGFAREVVGLRKAGIVGKLPQKLEQPPGDVRPVDEKGKVFDDLRGAGSIVYDVADYMRRSGTDQRIIADWSNAQAGSSYSALALAAKQFWMEQRRVPASSYFVKNAAGQRKAYQDAVQRHGGEAYRRAWQIWHALTYEMLGKTAMRFNDQSARVVRLIRTETSGVIIQYKVQVGPGQAMKRGPHESASIFGVARPVGDEITLQEVPHHRVTAAYFFDRFPGYGGGLLLGDGENEFLFLPEGVKFEYTGRRKPDLSAGINWKATP
jgi:SPP1 gp7 family putative phage head morphogenesis protein